jgi:hypothetical protein
MVVTVSSRDDVTPVATMLDETATLPTWIEATVTLVMRVIEATEILAMVAAASGTNLSPQDRP